MNVEQVSDHARTLVGLYGMLIEDTARYVHDPEDHNLCTAVWERPGFQLQTYVSYSNPSGLPLTVLRNWAPTLIPHPNTHAKLIDRGKGMADLHTEVRLINYLHSIGVFNTPGTVSFFSTRTICTGCKNAILDTQRIVAKMTALIPIELKVEDPGSEANKWYSMNIRPGTRDRSPDQGSMNID